MPEICRVHNTKSYTITVAVEPWGTQYTVPGMHYLSVWIDEETALVEIVLESEKEINVYLNECTFDDFSTKIISFNPGDTINSGDTILN